MRDNNSSVVGQVHQEKAEGGRREAEEEGEVCSLKEVELSMSGITLQVTVNSNNTPLLPHSAQEAENPVESAATLDSRP